MSSDESIKKSINRNTLKRKTELNPAASISESSNFQLFTRLMNGVHLSKIALTISIVLSIVLFQTLRGAYELTVLETIPFLPGLFIVCALLFLLYFYIQYVPYQKFLKNKLTLASGWVEFVSSRSQEFMKGKRFVRVIITIQPTATANTVHHNALSDFLSDWVKRSDSIYSGTTWKKGRPDSFKVSGFTVNGHVGVGNGMTFVIRSLSNNLMSLLAKIGEQNLTFSIRYENEITFDEDTSLDSIDAAKDREYERRLRD
jgi:hypothetical protein